MEQERLVYFGIVYVSCDSEARSTVTRPRTRVELGFSMARDTSKTVVALLSVNPSVIQSFI
jgi:hypothetical protein